MRSRKGPGQEIRKHGLKLLAILFTSYVISVKLLPCSGFLFYHFKTKVELDICKRVVPALECHRILASDCYKQLRAVNNTAVSTLTIRMGYASQKANRN